MSGIINQIDSFKLALEEDNSNEYFRSDSIFLKPDKLFPFDPNNTSPQEWKSLGLSDHQIKIINNYRAKGGEFRTRNDFYKIYGISKKQADMLVPFIYIPDKEIVEKAIEDVLDKERIVLTEFDPNAANDSTLLSLGFSTRNIKTINNYRNKGGEFFVKEDLKKIYGLDSSLYLLLEEYIVISNFEKTIINEKKQAVKSYKRATIEINSADSSLLLDLPGIGPVFSNRIIKYRKLLGGFSDKKQLLEVYNMDSVRYKGFSDLIIVDNSLIRKISLNFSSKEEFQKHPYLDKDQAKALVKFRSRKGNFKKISQIDEEKIINKSTYQKIFPYLSLNQ